MPCQPRLRPEAPSACWPRATYSSGKATRLRPSTRSKAADVINVLVVQDREQASAQIGFRLPKMLLGDGADQAILHKVVGPHRVAGQCAGIAPQPWDFGLEPLSKVAHRHHFRGSSLG
jgi:hypothetical protein